jgi:hypothetical protein
VAGVAALLAGAVLLAGCGGDGVRVDGYHLAAADRAACAALLDALPARVADQPHRKVTGSPYAAAWGDPAIVLRCGVGKPAGYDRFARCQRADGVDWFVPESTIADQSKDAVMTTIGRSPAVEVGLPAHYRPEGAAGAMVDLAAAIKAHTAEIAPCT